MVRLGYGISITMSLIFAVLFFASSTVASDAETYYASISADLKDNDLRSALYDLISNHTVLSYDSVWSAFEPISKTSNNYPCSDDQNQIPDVYSNHCWNTFSNSEGGECGNYKKEGDCFNREHLWPTSWFGGFSNGDNAETDLWELYPSDGYVNGLRGDLPLGPITCDEEATYVSSNGSKIGPCDLTALGDSGYSGACFEPSNELKGDFARSYFYLATAYWNKWTCCDEPGVHEAGIKQWLSTVLQGWHEQDPVDESERKKNDMIYDQFQHNRNPFVDHPEYVARISDWSASVPQKVH